MSVVGVGTDIVDIRRIEGMSERAREKLARRILTTTEYQQCFSLKYPERFLAKRWAAKEAAAKSLGTGIANGVSFQHICITSKSSGQPVVELSGVALEFATNLGAKSWHLSLSDEKNYATAFFVLSM